VSEDESILFGTSGSWDSPSDTPHLTYVWDFGDGSNGPGITVNHAYPEMGTYNVVLTVNDGKSTNSRHVEIEVENVLPTANAGTPKERKATVGKPVILDASGTTDTTSDINELNYTWKIGEETVYGVVVHYTFLEAGEFTVTLVVRDNDGETSEETVTFSVSEKSESDDAAMNSISWILVVIIIVILVVIGFLMNGIRNEALYREMKAEEEASDREMISGEEAIIVEGEIDDDMFKPKDDVQETIVEVAEEQEEGMTDAEVAEGEMDDDMFKPPGDVQETTEEVAVEQEVEISKEDTDIVR